MRHLLLPVLAVCGCGSLSAPQPQQLLDDAAVALPPPAVVNPTSPPPPFFCVVGFQWNDLRIDSHYDGVETFSFLAMPGSNLEGYTMGYGVDLPDWGDTSAYTPFTVDEDDLSCGEAFVDIPLPFDRGTHQIQVALWKPDEPTVYSCVQMRRASDPLDFGIRNTPGWATYAVIGENAIPYPIEHQRGSSSPPQVPDSGDTYAAP